MLADIFVIFVSVLFAYTFVAFLIAIICVTFTFYWHLLNTRTNLNMRRALVKHKFDIDERIFVTNHRRDQNKLLFNWGFISPLSTQPNTVSIDSISLCLSISITIHAQSYAGFFSGPCACVVEFLQHLCYWKCFLCIL